MLLTQLSVTVLHHHPSWLMEKLLGALCKQRSMMKSFSVGVHLAVKELEQSCPQTFVYLKWWIVSVLTKGFVVANRYCSHHLTVMEIQGHCWSTKTTLLPLALSLVKLLYVHLMPEDSMVLLTTYRLCLSSLVWLLLCREMSYIWSHAGQHNRIVFFS